MRAVRADHIELVLQYIESVMQIHKITSNANKNFALNFIGLIFEKHYKCKSEYIFKL